MLDQNVPNPLAKNPNFHTHKVFAAIGIILIVVIIIFGIFAYVFRGQIGDFVMGVPQSSNIENPIKTSTSSAKTATSSSEKNETADWETYTSKTFSVKYPIGWTKSNDASDLENVVFRNSGMKVTIIIITNGGVSPNTQGYSKWETIDVKFNDKITKANEITFNDGTWTLFAQGAGSKGEWYETLVDRVPTAAERTTMAMILSTFKFL